MNNNNQHQSPNPLMLLGLGVAAGWLAKKFFESDAMKQKREEAMIRMEDLRDELMDTDEAARLQDIFGDVGADVKDAYEMAQKQLVKELTALKTTWEDLDQGQYMDTVAGIITDLKDKQTLPEAKLKKLKTALEDDFAKLQKNRAAGRRSRNTGRAAKAK